MSLLLMFALAKMFLGTVGASWRQRSSMSENPILCRRVLPCGSVTLPLAQRLFAARSASFCRLRSVTLPPAQRHFAACTASLCRPSCLSCQLARTDAPTVRGPALPRIVRDVVLPRPDPIGAHAPVRQPCPRHPPHSRPHYSKTFQNNFDNNGKHC